MSEAPENIQGIEGGEQVDNAIQAKNKPSGNMNAATTFVSNADDLATKAPEVYAAMMDAAARKIIREQQRHNQRMKQLMREGQRGPG